VLKDLGMVGWSWFVLFVLTFLLCMKSLCPCNLQMFKLQSTEIYRSSDGQKMVVGILKDESESLEVLNTRFTVVTAAATNATCIRFFWVDPD